MRHLALAGAAMAILVSSGAMAQTNAAREAARANFGQADVNGDGKLSRREFRMFVNANAEDGLGQAGMVRRFSAYDRAFARVDQNGSGFVTPAELSAIQGD
ncbi:MAG: hypothetical protein HKN78_12695 [Sphingomonadaceae bacterium]|nr:hypothetical protein [Sphingomonadaceae bacterium]